MRWDWLEQEPPAWIGRLVVGAAALGLLLGWLVVVAWLAAGQWPQGGVWLVLALVVCTAALGRASARWWREARR